ncbi:MAG: hypothetical protein HGB06_00435 [Chlorobaculum sp.]|jgi:hypothetical protein|nr:hypothetical protein [Chlorobaculum sp.]
MERYCFIEPWENLQDGEHQAAISFALTKSKELNTKLVICVHSKKHCDQFLEKCFSNESLAKKLINGQKITTQGVTVTLESLITLRKKIITESVVYLALFPSQDLLTALESSNANVAAIIVFSEVQYSEHLIEWKKKFKPHILECQTTD